VLISATTTLTTTNLGFKMLACCVLVS